MHQFRAQRSAAIDAATATVFITTAAPGPCRGCWRRNRCRNFRFCRRCTSGRKCRMLNIAIAAGSTRPTGLVASDTLGVWRSRLFMMYYGRSSLRTHGRTHKHHTERPKTQQTYHGVTTMDNLVDSCVDTVVQAKLPFHLQIPTSRALTYVGKHLHSQSVHDRSIRTSNKGRQPAVFLASILP